MKTSTKNILFALGCALFSGCPLSKADPKAKSDPSADLIKTIESSLNNKQKTKEARKLLAAGANADTKNNRGDTALMMAIEKGNTKIAKLLIDAGADLDTRDSSGRTAFSRAYYAPNSYEISTYIKGVIAKNKYKDTLANAIKEPNLQTFTQFFSWSSPLKATDTLSNFDNYTVLGSLQILPKSNWRNNTTWHENQRDNIIKYLLATPGMSAYPENISLPKKIIIQGDINGDLAGLQENLRQANLIDWDNDWIGKDAVLIQTGNIIGQCNKSIEVNNFLRELQKQARQDNGNVIRLLGSHEVLLLKKCALGAKATREEKNKVERACDELKRTAKITYDTNALAAGLKNEIRDGNIQAAYALNNKLFFYGTLIKELSDISSELPSTKTQKTTATSPTMKNVAVALNFELIKTLTDKKNPTIPEDIFQIEKAIERAYDQTKNSYDDFWQRYDGKNNGINARTNTVENSQDPDIISVPGFEIITLNTDLCDKKDFKNRNDRAFLVIEKDARSKQVQLKSIFKKQNRWYEKILAQEF